MLWQPVLTRSGENEKKERGDKTKHKNSNICRRFQPDSLMWITQHSVPWPPRTKGGRCLRSGAGHPGRQASAPRSTPGSFRWAGFIVPWAGQRGATRAPGTACHLDCHSFGTKMAAWQMKPSGAGIKHQFQSRELGSPCHMNADQGQTNNDRSVC